MQTLELTAPELEVLREVLQHELTQMEVEVFRTDSPDFKEMLKRRRGVLELLVAKLSSTPVAVQSPA